MRGIAILVICDYRGRHGLDLPTTNADADEIEKLLSSWATIFMKGRMKMQQNT